jgi:hypothetical protein
MIPKGREAIKHNMTKQPTKKRSVTWQVAIDDAEREEILARVFRILMGSLPEEIATQERNHNP